MAGTGITLEDVQAAIAALGKTPESTNAGAIRDQIGAGSLSTIQKHLAALRTPPAPAPVAVQEPPKELLTSLWMSALSAAGVDLGTRIERLTVERDRLAGDLALARNDADAALAAADEAWQAASTAKERYELENIRAEALVDTVASAERTIEELQSNAKSDREGFEQQAEMRLQKVRHDCELQVSTLRSLVESSGQREGRLHTEVAELRERLGRQEAELEARAKHIAELQTELEKCRAQRANGDSRG